MKLTKLLVPVDFSECSLAAVVTAAELARHFSSELHLLHCSEHAGVASEDLWVGNREAGRGRSLGDLILDNEHREMHEFLEKVPELSDVHVEVGIAKGYPAETICEAAKRGDYDVVVMSTHGRRGFRALLIGSVAERVVRLCERPVLTVPGVTGADEPKP